MAFGIFILVIGYALFYWGAEHFGTQCRYSLWCLLGFGSVFKTLNVTAGNPFTFPSTSQTPSNANPASPSSPVTTPGRPTGRVGPPTASP